MAPAVRTVLAGRTDRRQALDAFWAQVDRGLPVALLDAEWPPAVRRSAERLVEQAAPRLRPGDLVLFTSGSAGQPRAVVRTAASWDASVDALTRITGIGPTDVVWLPGSLASTLSLYGAWHARRVGAQVVTGPAGTRAVGLVARATAIHTVPAIAAQVVARGEAGGLPTLRTLVVAGAAPDSGVASRARALGWRWVEYYGAAELSFVAWRDDESPGLQRFPAVEWAIRDSVVWVRSPYVAREYLPVEATRPLRADDGWASTGDLGRLLPSGRLEVYGRGDAAINTGGHTVVAEEVEVELKLTLSAVGVSDLAVVGLPHPRFGELVTVVVEPEVDLPAATRAAAVRNLPGPARPRRWLAMAQLPRTPAGKVARADLRRALETGTVSATQVPGAP